jgi:hypothetical protein
MLDWPAMSPGQALGLRKERTRGSSAGQMDSGRAVHCYPVTNTTSAKVRLRASHPQKAILSLGTILLRRRPRPTMRAVHEWSDFRRMTGVRGVVNDAEVLCGGEKLQEMNLSSTWVRQGMLAI